MLWQRCRVIAGGCRARDEFRLAALPSCWWQLHKLHTIVVHHCIIIQQLLIQLYRCHIWVHCYIIFTLFLLQHVYSRRFFVLSRCQVIVPFYLSLRCLLLWNEKLLVHFERCWVTDEYTFNIAWAFFLCQVIKTHQMTSKNLFLVLISYQWGSLWWHFRVQGLLFRLLFVRKSLHFLQWHRVLAAIVLYESCLRRGLQRVRLPANHPTSRWPSSFDSSVLCHHIFTHRRWLDIGVFFTSWDFGGLLDWDEWILGGLFTFVG